MVDLKARNDAIADAYMTGSTLDEIGAIHGLTRERVRQIVARQARMRALSSELSKGTSLEDAARLHGVKEHVARLAWAKLNPPRRFDPGDNPMRSVDGADEAERGAILTIEHLELSVRSSNCLRAADVNTIGDLLTLHEDDLMRLPNFGRKSLGEVRTALEGHGLSLSAISNRPFDRINERNEAIRRGYGDGDDPASLAIKHGLREIEVHAVLSNRAPYMLYVPSVGRPSRSFEWG